MLGLVIRSIIEKTNKSTKRWKPLLKGLAFMYDLLKTKTLRAIRATESLNTEVSRSIARVALTSLLLRLHRYTSKISLSWAPVPAHVSAKIKRLTKNVGSKALKNKT